MLISFEKEFEEYFHFHCLPYSFLETLYFIHKTEIDTFIDAHRDNTKLLCRVWCDLYTDKFDNELFPERSASEVEFFVALRHRLEYIVGSYDCSKYLCTVYAKGAGLAEKNMTDKEFDRDILSQMYNHYRYMLAKDGEH